MPAFTGVTPLIVPPPESVNPEPMFNSSVPVDPTIWLLLAMVTVPEAPEPESKMPFWPLRVRVPLVPVPPRLIVPVIGTLTVCPLAAATVSEPLTFRVPPVFTVKGVAELPELPSSTVSDPDEPMVRFGPFEADLRTGELRKRGIRIKLPRQAFQLLAALAERPGELVTRDQLQSILWPNETIVEFDHSINTAVKRIREALSDSADRPRYLETLPRRGYRFMADVDRIETPPPRLPVKPPIDWSDPLGKIVSHYRVLEVLGKGRMGIVYRAEDIRLGRSVALKFLPVDLESDAAALQRFEQEARMASALSHPNICTIYEVEAHEGRPFIAMELLEDETLRDRIVRKAPGAALSAAELLDSGIAVADALEAAHTSGIIHRDIKPGNIFLTRRGEVKVLDFGLAKVLVAAADSPPVLRRNHSGERHCRYCGIYVAGTGLRRRAGCAQRSLFTRHGVI